MSVKGSSSIDVGFLRGQLVKSVSVEEGGSKLKSPSVSRFPVSSLEVEGDSNRVILSQVSNFSSLILSSLSSLSTVSSWDIGEFVLNQINELLVVIDTSSGDENFAWGDILELELLEDVARKISDVSLESLNWETESLKSVGGSENGIVEILTSLQELVEFVGVLVLGLSDFSGND